MLELQETGISTGIRSRYLEQLRRFTHEEQENVVVSHYGVFSQDLINSLADGTEDMMISAGDQRLVIKRVFSILIEGLQNIRMHATIAKNNKQLAYFLLTKKAASYRFVFGNLIRQEEAEQVCGFIDKINSLEGEALKDFYRKSLMNCYLSKKGGAGLGFITMRTRSGNLLRCETETLENEKSFLRVEIIVDRNY